METKINSRLFFMGMFCLILAVVLSLLVFRGAFYKRAEENVEAAAGLIASVYNSSPESFDPAALEMGSLRLTLISGEGQVLYENKAAADEMDDHSQREEVIKALSDGSASVTRHSSTLGADTYYCAIRLENGDIIRVSSTTSDMWELYDKAVKIVVLLGFGILLASIALSVVLTKQLVAPISGLTADLDEIEDKVPYPELRPFAMSLREYRLRERQNEQQRREFTANVSHELKTPLTSISGYAEMLENGMCRPEDVKSFGERIHSEAARLIALVGDVIRLTQMDEADAPPTFEKVDLFELARNTADRLSLNAGRADVAIECRGVSVYVMGNAGMLGEMIYNLCDNAIRYNRPGGHVWMTCGIDEDRRAYIEVRDDGIGIPLEHQSRVFERFYRVDKSHGRETGGTGLGLAIVKHTVSLHGGGISLVSSDGKGTAITVTLPSADS